MANIIEKQGWRQPIKVSTRSGYIVSGHGRYEAALFIGAEAVPVDFQDYADEESELADLLADNRIAELADMDEQKLAELFAEINLEDMDLDLTGYTKENVEEIIELADLLIGNNDIDLDKADEEIPPPEDENISKQGDIWLLGNHRLICGDSTKAETYTALLGDELAQLIVTDPPYNVNYESKAGKIQNDNMSSSEFRSFLADVYKCLSDFAQPGAGIYVFHADSEGVAFRDELIKSGFLFKQCLIWVKNQFVLGRQDYQWRHEPCLYGWKDGAAHYFTGKRNLSTVIDETKRPDFESMSRPELIEFLECLYDDFDEVPSSIIYCDKPLTNDEHPTMKPVKLIAELVKNSSKPDWVVMDAFGGSGSTLIACEATGRKARLIELDEKFCDVIVKRYLKTTNKTDVTLIRDGKEIPLNKTGII